MKRMFLACDHDKSLHLFVGTQPPVMDTEPKIFTTGGDLDLCEYGGQVYPENIDGPIPAPGTFVECRLTITKGKKR